MSRPILPNRLGDSRLWIFAALVVVALLAVVETSYRLSQRLLAGDAFALFSPYYSLVSDFAAAGELLLWDPWSNCGSPAHAYVEMGSFSPLTVFHAWLTGGGHLGFHLYWLTIWGIGGLGLLMLGRHLAAPVWGSLAVAVSLMFSGFYLGHAVHVSWLYSFSFLPWILWRTDVALERDRLWPSVEAGALYGLSALAGHPALVIINGLFLGAWSIVRLASRTRATDAEAGTERRFALRAALRTAVVLAVVLGVGSVVLSPAYIAFLVDAAGYADRVGALDRVVAVSDHQLHPTAIATMASPYLPILKFTNPSLWVGTWLGLTANYIGPLVPALAILALVQQPRNRTYWAIAAVGMLNLAWAVGDSLPLRGWLYDLLPPTRYFRHTAVFRGYLLLSMAILALFGARELEALRAQAWKRLGWISSALLALMLVAYVLTLRAAPERAPGFALANAQFALAWAGMPCLCLLALSRRLRSQSWVVAPILGLIVCDGLLSVYQSLPLMSRVYDGIESDAARRNRSLEMERYGLSRAFNSPRGLSNLHLLEKTPTVESFNTLNSRFHTSRGVGSANWHNLSESWSDVRVLRLGVSRNARRTWFSTEVVELVPSDAAFAAYVARARELDALPMVVHRRDTLLASSEKQQLMNRGVDPGSQIATLPAARRIEVDLHEYRPAEMAFSVDVPASGWLLVTDRWARGWKGWVDGQPAEVWGGSFIFRALPLEPGRHEVVFRYAPFLHPWLTVASWGTLASIALVSAYLWRASRGSTLSV
jgi:hypothetical protein